MGKDGPTDVADEGNKNPLNAPQVLQIPQRNSRKEYKNLRYPTDLKSELQDVMKFTQLEYGSREFKGDNTSASEFVTGFGKDNFQQLTDL